MSTRGFMGFKVDKTLKIAYNHFDSYPDGLGVEMLQWLLETNLLEAEARATRLKVITEDTPITPDDLLNLAVYTNTHVGNQGIKNEVVHDWYQLLHGCQGNPHATLESGYILDAHEFPYDSLFCEWGYLVNFDEHTFEVYKGFQTAPPTEGEFTDGPGRPAYSGSTYFPVNRVARWQFSKLPTPDEFVLELKEDDEED